jgi:hypothetical protein
LKKYGFGWLYRDFFYMWQYFWPHAVHAADDTEPFTSHGITRAYTVPLLFSLIGNIQSNMPTQSPVLKSHFFLSCHRKFHMNLTFLKRSPVLKSNFLCSKDDLLIQVWLCLYLCTTCISSNQYFAFDIGKGPVSASCSFQHNRCDKH